MEIWQLWFLATLDGWNNLLVIMFVISLLALAPGLIAFVVTGAIEDKEAQYAHKLLKPLVKAAVATVVISGLLGAMLPSTKAAWVMVGAYVATNIEDVEKLPANTVRALNHFLKQYAPTEGKK